MLDFRREFWKVAEGCWRLNISKKLNGSRMIIKRKQLAAHLANPTRASTNCFNRVMLWSVHGPWFVFVRFQAIGVKGMTRGNRDLTTRVSIGSCSKLW